MTIFAGAFVLDPSAGDVPEDVSRQLHAAISRQTEPRIEIRKPGFYCVKIDIGALLEPGLLEDARGASILAGEPLIGSEAAYRPRNQDLAIIHERFLKHETAILAETHGTFAVAHYCQEAHSLVLAADKLGVRCLYYWRDRSIIVFATARRILQAIGRVPKILDQRGAFEAVAFGTPLQRRTEFENIFCLDAGESIRFGEEGEERSRYFRWDLQSATPADETFDISQVHSAFTRAVSRRLRPTESGVVCFLSGGLDSRCIVSALKSSDREVYTLNFSRPGTYDQVISGLFSKQLGTTHSAIAGPMEDFIHPAKHARSFLAELHPSGLPVQRPAAIWSGDGGSVGLGYVYLNERMIELARAGDLTGAISAFIADNRSGIPKSCLAGDLRRQLVRFVETAMREAIDTYETDDLAKRMFLFLMLNDQRRHLAKFYEEVDVWRCELVLPFFDSDVIAASMAVPVERGLGHKLYYEWLQCFPSVVTSVPWQAYPGHLPCPLEMPAAIGQWDRRASRAGARKRADIIRAAVALALRPGFPTRLLSRSRVLAAILAARLRIRDTAASLAQAIQLSKFAESASGVAVPAAHSPTLASEQERLHQPSNRREAA